MNSDNSIIKQVDDGIEDHNGNDIVEISIFIEVSKDVDVDVLPFNAITALMQRLAQKASQTLIGIFKALKGNGDFRSSSNGRAPDS